MEVKWKLYIEVDNTPFHHPNRQSQQLGKMSSLMLSTLTKQTVSLLGMGGWSVDEQPEQPCK